MAFSGKPSRRVPGRWPRRRCSLYWPACGPASLTSPCNVPVQEAAEGIIRGFEVEARARTEAMAREGVNTSAPMPASGPPVGDAADPEAQPEVPAEEAVAGQ